MVYVKLVEQTVTHVYVQQDSVDSTVKLKLMLVQITHV
jgi:hypothetical protein